MTSDMKDGKQIGFMVPTGQVGEFSVATYDDNGLHEADPQGSTNNSQGSALTDEPDFLERDEFWHALQQYEGHYGRGVTQPVAFEEFKAFIRARIKARPAPA